MVFDKTDAGPIFSPVIPQQMQSLVVGWPCIPLLSLQEDFGSFAAPTRVRARQALQSTPEAVTAALFEKDQQDLLRRRLGKGAVGAPLAPIRETSER